MKQTYAAQYPMRDYGTYFGTRGKLLRTMSQITSVQRPYLNLWFDGGAIDSVTPHCRGRWAFTVSDGRCIIAEASGDADGNPVTVNTAEYQGLYSGLAWLSLNGGCHGLRIFGDSKLVITQLNGRWQARDQLLTWREKCWDLIEGYVFSWSAMWKPRHFNSYCDPLVKEGRAA